VELMAASESKREAIEVAARPLRELMREEHDEIAAAQRALRQAEKVHDRAIRLAERQLRAARSAQPLSAYGHEVVLYADRLSTAGGTHELTPEVSAWIEDSRVPGRMHRHELTLKVAGPTWREEVTFPRRDERKLRRLAQEIEAAAHNAQTIGRAARADAEQAERDLVGAWADRRAVEETRALIHRLDELVDDDEDVIDMAPGISAGHDGVLVASDRRLLFISVRRTLSVAYEHVSSADVKGKWFGARLVVSTTGGNVVISGIAPGHAAEIADLVRSRIPREAATG
jgi:Bacterial PH domain